MGLIDKFKKTENTELLHAELKAKVIKEEEIPIPTTKVAGKGKNLPKENNITKSETVTEDHQKDFSDGEKEVDNLELFIEDFLTEYYKSDKSSRMIRIQKKNFDALSKLKGDNISISQFVNYAIHSTLKSEQYKKIIKTIVKTIKNKQ